MANNFLDNYAKKKINEVEEVNEAQPVTHDIEFVNLDSDNDDFEDNNFSTEADPMSFEQKSDFKPPQIHNNVSKNNNKLLPYYIGGGIGLIVIIGIIIYFLLNRNVTIEDMTGWKESDANTWAEENGMMLRYTEKHSDKVKADLVISQNPKKGTKVDKGSFLELTISQGPDLSKLVKLPDFMTMKKTQVETWAADNHMTKVRITAENSQLVPAGQTLFYTVNDNSTIGDEVRRDSPVYVTFSNGTGKDGKITLPDFTTMTLEQAEAFALDNGFKLEIEKVFDASIPKDSVISQSIALDEIIRVEDIVKLKVSKGPKIVVPNFGAYTLDVAMEKAAQAGITSVLTQDRYSTKKKGSLISQSLSVGSLFDPESDILTLVFSLGNEIPITEFPSLDLLNTWVGEENEKGANLSVKVTYTASEGTPGTIISQNHSNTTVGIGTKITVVVSEGNIVYMPDFVGPKGNGYTSAVLRTKAIEQCNKLGIVPVFQEARSQGRLQGEVWSQSIAPGKEVQQGSTVTLKYVPVTSTVVVPNFIGMTKAQVNAAGHHNTFTLIFGSEDVIKAQSVAAGTTVAPGSSIAFDDADLGIPPDSGDEDIPDNG